MAASLETTSGLNSGIGALSSEKQPPSVTPEPQEIEDDTKLRTVDDLVRSRARTNPHDVVVSYPSAGIDYVDYTFQQLDVFAYRAARHYQALIPTRASSAEKPTVVALLGPSNLEYLVTMVALTKLGHTVLFLSTRISQAAIESLMVATDAQFLLADPRFAETANESVEKLPYVKVGGIAPASVFDFPIEVHADTRIDYALDHDVETNNRIYIIHSSGSTGLPKPIFQTQKSALANYAFSMNMKAFITLPLYHNHGICNLYRAVFAKKPLHMYNADLPLTEDYLIKIMAKHDFEIFYGVPYALKLLSESERGVDLLQKLKIVMYGGSACPDELGNFLVGKGVNLIGHYGATEVGQLMTSFRPKGDNDWNYVREHDRLKPYLRWIPRGPNVFECSVAEGWPSKVASNQPDGSYNTKDLFEPHPTTPHAWKYLARSDDTIALVNGEKFNPVQLEGRIRTNKAVTEAVVFGSGRPAVGVLIVPSAATEGKSNDEIADLVMPTLEGEGAPAEAYARISRGMIRVLPRGDDYPRTDKGSVIRQAFYRKYAREIDETYDAADQAAAATGDDGKKLKALGIPEIKAFLREALVRLAGKRAQGVSDDADLFSLGVDSLQAIQLRSEILRAVDTRGHRLGQNVVFDHPSISKLSAYLFELAAGNGDSARNGPAVESEMAALVDRYGTFPAAPATGDRPPFSVVVTGATGSIGAHVAGRLAADPAVDRVYCLVRARDHGDALRRVHESLRERRVYDTMVGDGEKGASAGYHLLHKILPLAADLADPRLGLSRDAYHEVTAGLRHVVHCAWAVNFNMNIASFERDCIAGVRHLIDLCRQSSPSTPDGRKASFNFCSSVSTVVNAPSPAPEGLPHFEWAQGTGYAQSKSVAEHICQRAAAAAGAGGERVPVRVLRVGQVVADTRHGVWNATEGITLMLQSALTTGALPRLRERPSWLPVDTVARAIAEISLSDAGGSQGDDGEFFVSTQIANHRHFDWTADLLPMLRRAGLRFDEVEPREWVARLRASDPDPAANPPIKLLDFFASKYDRDEFSPSKTYETAVARGLSPSLADAPVLDQELVDKFVGHFLATAWKETAEKARARESSS